jgi:hypothetical protein
MRRCSPTRWAGAPRRLETLNPAEPPRVRAARHVRDALRSHRPDRRALAGGDAPAGEPRPAAGGGRGCGPGSRSRPQREVVGAFMAASREATSRGSSRSSIRTSSCAPTWRSASPGTCAAPRRWPARRGCITRWTAARGRRSSTARRDRGSQWRADLRGDGPPSRTARASRSTSLRTLRGSSSSLSPERSPAVARTGAVT